jgi:hypothetical protein
LLAALEGFFAIAWTSLSPVIRTPLARPCTDTHQRLSAQPRSRTVSPYSMNISEISKSKWVFVALLFSLTLKVAVR